MKKVIIITGPSGVGKNTVADHILATFPFLSYSVSATTRQPREGEKDAVDYYFLAVEDFKKRIANDEFIEWEEVYTDKFYGTLKSEVQRIWDKGHSVIFVVDVVGAKDLKKYFGDKALSIFVLPPSIQALKERLQKRGSEQTFGLEERLRRAKMEIDQAGYFDKQVVNDKLEIALKQADDMVNTFFS